MGEQAYSDRLMPRVREYEVAGHWTFLGNLDPIEMAAFYPNLNVLTVPSLNSTEAFGLVQIEAMMNGVPSVPPRCPACASLCPCMEWDASPKLGIQSI